MRRKGQKFLLAIEHFGRIKRKYHFYRIFAMPIKDEIEWTITVLMQMFWCKYCRFVCWWHWFVCFSVCGSKRQSESKILAAVYRSKRLHAKRPNRIRIRPKRSRIFFESFWNWNFWDFTRYKGLKNFFLNWIKICKNCVIF